MQGTPVVLALLALLAAGCVAPDVPGAVTVAGRDLPTQEPEERIVLADADVTFEVPPQLGVATGRSEWRLDDVTVPPGVRNVGFEFTRSNGAGVLAADTCRVDAEDASLGAARFDGDATSGLSMGEEICAVRIWNLAPGDYTPVYVLEEVAPGSAHSVHLRVIADLEPWRPAQW